MKLKISSVADRGVIAKERLILKALVTADIGDFAVLQTGYDENGVTTTIHQAYWFPYKNISAGDLVVIYTKAGTDSEKDLGNNRKAHFFYWGIPAPIWDDKDKAPVLLFAREWESKAPDQL
jgi:hypothetical protein